MLRFTGGLAHRKNRSRRRNGIGDSDKGFLRDMPATGTRERKNRSAQEGKPEAKKIRAASVRIHADEDGDRGSQRRNLGESKVHKDDTSLDHVHAKIRMNAGQDQAGHKGPKKKWKYFHG